MKNVPERLQRLKKRRDFLSAMKARRWSTPGFVLQARQRLESGDIFGARVGFTASKKVGGAVARNRAKRRLRALADMTLAQFAKPDWDYVLIARAQSTVARPFSALQADLATALERVHRERRASEKQRAKRDRDQTSEDKPALEAS